MVGYICYRGIEPGLNRMKIERRLVGLLDLQWLHLCRLRTNSWSLSLVMLNACLSLSWPNLSVWPQSQVARLRAEAGLLECASKGNHCKFLVSKGRYLEVLNILVAWYPWECGADRAHDFWVVRKVIYGSLGTGLSGECWECPLSWVVIQFESPSLPVSENLMGLSP
jgi:hypothetical protein